MVEKSGVPRILPVDLDLSFRIPGQTTLGHDVQTRPPLLLHDLLER